MRTPELANIILVSKGGKLTKLKEPMMNRLDKNNEVATSHDLSKSAECHGDF